MKVLVVRSLCLLVDAFGDDHIAEARKAVTAVNRALENSKGAPVIDFDLPGSADIEASYEEAEEA